MTSFYYFTLLAVGGNGGGEGVDNEHRIITVKVTGIDVKQHERY